MGESFTAAEERRATLWRPLTPVERLSMIAAAVAALKAEDALNTARPTP